MVDLNFVDTERWTDSDLRERKPSQKGAASVAFGETNADAEQTPSLTMTDAKGVFFS